MARSTCGVCKAGVTANGVGCERCEAWIHMACVGIKTSSNLNNKNLVFLCDDCLSRSRKEWMKKKAEEDKSVQTEKEEMMEEKSAQTEDAHTPPQRRVVPTKRMRRTKAPIRVIGDSMVKNLAAHVKCTMEGSGCASLRGAHIPQIKRKVIEEADQMRDGMLILQGGGNGLEHTGEEKTVKEVLEAVKAVEGKGMSVAVVGVLRRPREGRQYEWLRMRTNRKIQEELLKLKMEWLREKKGNVSFIDLDGVLHDGLFAADGVHLSEAGTARMGRRICEWVRARSLRPVEVVDVE